MIEICPAILTSSSKELKEELLSYSKLFNIIDIDINVDNDDFTGQITRRLEDVITILETMNEVPFLNLHLMVENPLKEINKVIGKSFENKIRFIIHQESSLDDVIFSFLGRDKIGATLKVDSELKDLEFYNKFSEVQLMTVSIGYQGNEFEKKVLEKSKELKDMGFTGIISIDGGVNLETVDEIKKYPINRVSVGSYFSKSEDLIKSKKELEAALNG
ncbi:MAG: hypothetical protein ABI721_03870 [Candidatus Dojkabacteria bacterium]